jgi:hypothetical protein
MLYNAFIGTMSLGDAAWTIAQSAFKTFNVASQFVSTRWSLFVNSKDKTSKSPFFPFL